MKSHAAEPWWGEGTPPDHWQERFAAAPVTGLEAAADIDDRDEPGADPTPEDSGRDACDVHMPVQKPVESGSDARYPHVPDPTQVTPADPEPAQPGEVDAGAAPTGRPSGMPVDSASVQAESGTEVVPLEPTHTTRRAAQYAPPALGDAVEVRPVSSRPGAESAVAAYEPHVGERRGPTPMAPDPGRASTVTAESPTAPTVAGLRTQTPSVHRASVDAIVAGVGSATPVGQVEPPVGRSGLVPAERGGWPELPPAHEEEFAPMWTPEQILRLRSEHRS